MQWLFLNKKFNHWKSTRATAQVIYSVAKYLKKTKQLMITEDATVDVGPVHWEFVFKPDKYTGKKNQIVIPGSEINPGQMAKIVVQKHSKGYLFASATWQFSTQRLPKEARGDFITIKRRYFKRVKTGNEVHLIPVDKNSVLHVGDEIEVQLYVRSKHPMEYVHLHDPRAAGFEPINVRSGYKWDTGLSYYDEVRDSGENFFFDWIPQGEYTFHYRVRVAMAGTFKIAPATIQPMYAPEFAAYSKGMIVRVSQ